MGKEKQIEEMAKVMGSRCMNACPDMTCPDCGATALYNAGYGNIAELKADNESIRQNSVSHETFKAIMDEKDKEIAVLNRALNISVNHTKGFIGSDYCAYDMCVKNCIYEQFFNEDMIKQQAKKELEE